MNEEMSNEGMEEEEADGLESNSVTGGGGPGKGVLEDVAASEESVTGGGGPR